MKFNKHQEKELLALIKTNISSKELLKYFNTSWPTLRKKLVELNLLPEGIKLREERLELAKNGIFRCIRCREIKNLEERASYTNRTRNHCKDCEVSFNKKKHIYLKTEGNLSEIFSMKMRGIKARAKKKGIGCDIDVKYLLKLFRDQNGKCYYSGLKMNWQIDDNYCVSIDRKDSNLGYTKDNVVLCCTIVNYMKIDFPIEEFKYFIKHINDNLGNF